MFDELDFLTDNDLNCIVQEKANVFCEMEKLLNDFQAVFERFCPKLSV